MSKEIIFFVASLLSLDILTLVVFALFFVCVFFKLNKTEELTFFLDSKDDSCRYLFY